MGLSPYIMSREQYEDRCRERLEILNPDDPERVARALLHRYPATSEQAAEELQTRGLDAAAEALPPLARNIGLEPRVIGRSHAWYPGDIDLLAEALEGANRLTHPAMWRRARGVSVAQEIAIEREVNARRQARLDAVGKTVGCDGGDVWEIVGDVLPDPLDWSDEDAERGRRADAGLGGRSSAIDGRRNERVRRVLTSYVDEIVIWPSTKTGLLRVNAFAADLAEVKNDTDRPAGDRSCVDEVAGVGFEPTTFGL